MSPKQLKILYTHVAFKLRTHNGLSICACAKTSKCVCVYELGFVIGGKALRETHISINEAIFHSDILIN